VSEIGEQFDVPLDIPIGNEHEIFLADVDRVGDWKAAIQRLEDGIGEVVQSWVYEDPSMVMRRLVSLRLELELSNVRWPDRVRMACRALADRVADPLAWADLALNRGLFPQASPFLEQAIAQGAELGEERLVRYPSTPAARWTTISAILTRVPQLGSRIVHESGQ
jgi:hypothetical protein